MGDLVTGSSPEIHNLISTVSAAVAALAAAATVIMTVQERGQSRRHERFVRWCEEPARVALERCQEQLLTGLEELVVGEPTIEVYQEQARVVQSCVRELERRLVHGALAVGNEKLESKVVKGCRMIEDSVLGTLHEYASDVVDDIDIDREVRMRMADVAGMIVQEGMTS